MATALQVEIGGVSISLEGDLLKAGCEGAASYGPFIREGNPAIRLQLHRTLFAEKGGEKIFECPPVWSLYRLKGRSVIEIFPDLPGLDRTLVLPKDLQKADLHFNPKAAMHIDPFYGPTMELLMVNHLAQGGGVIVHGCGVARGGAGLLFVGESGAGKSTMATLWNQEKGIEVLSDDRTIVRKRGDAFWIYGTPWHGEGKFASPGTVRLNHIFFLKHARRNSLRDFQGVESVSRLLACSFPPHWDAGGMGFTLDLFSDLVGRVPCRELAFRPDRSVIEFLIEGLRD